MSFASEVKAEICKVELSDVCCKRAELVGIIGFAANITENSIHFRTENGMVANRYFGLIKDLYNIEPETRISESGLFHVNLDGGETLKIIRDLKLSTVPMHIASEVIRNQCCKNSLIRGAFMGGGSMTAPDKDYHTEINTNRYSICTDFMELLKVFEIYPKRINRNGNFVLYLKDSEQIENLLAAIGAYNKMMDFLNIKIEKDLRNTTNRLVNCENANILKVTNASVTQRVAIKKIIDNIGFEGLTPELQVAAKARMENTDESLSELAKIIGVSKSCLNHRMRKLMSIAEKY